MRSKQHYIDDLCNLANQRFGYQQAIKIILNHFGITDTNRVNYISESARIRDFEAVKKELDEIRKSYT